MEISYVNKGLHNFLDVDIGERCELLQQGIMYKIKMLENNNLDGVISPYENEVDGKIFLRYNTESAYVMEKIMQKIKPDKVFLESIINQLVHSVRSLEEFLLNPNDLIIDPSYMFFYPKQSQIKLICVPGYNKDIICQLKNFLEYVMKIFNHRDQTGVIYLYDLYDKITNKEFTFDAENVTNKDDTFGSMNVTNKDDTFGSMNVTNKDATFGSVNVTNKDVMFGSGNVTNKDVMFGSVNVTNKDVTLGSRNAIKKEHSFELNKDVTVERDSKTSGNIMNSSQAMFEDEEETKLKKAYISIAVAVVAAITALCRYAFYGNQIIWLWLCVSMFAYAAISVVLEYAKEKQEQEIDVSMSIYSDEPQRRIENVIDNNKAGEEKKSYKLVPLNNGAVPPIEICDTEIKIGRSKEEADYRLKKTQISRIHARVFVVEGKLCLIDEASTNGTFINNVRIDAHELNVIDIGDVVAFATEEYFVA